MALETIQLEHVPATHSVHVSLFRNVANADFLHRQLLSRNQEFEYAFIDATSVSIPCHLAIPAIPCLPCHTCPSQASMIPQVVSYLPHPAEKGGPRDRVTPPHVVDYFLYPTRCVSCLLVFAHHGPVLGGIPTAGGIGRVQGHHRADRG